MFCHRRRATSVQSADAVEHLLHERNLALAASAASSEQHQESIPHSSRRISSNRCEQSRTERQPAQKGAARQYTAQFDRSSSSCCCGESSYPCCCSASAPREYHSDKRSYRYNEDERRVTSREYSGCYGDKKRFDDKSHQYVGSGDESCALRRRRRSSSSDLLRRDRYSRINNTSSGLHQPSKRSVCTNKQRTLAQRSHVTSAGVDTTTEAVKKRATSEATQTPKTSTPPPPFTSNPSSNCIIVLPLMILPIAVMNSSSPTPTSISISIPLPPNTTSYTTTPARTYALAKPTACTSADSDLKKPVLNSLLSPSFTVSSRISTIATPTTRLAKTDSSNSTGFVVARKVVGNEESKAAKPHRRRILAAAQVKRSAIPIQLPLKNKPSFTTSTDRPVTPFSSSRKPVSSTSLTPFKADRSPVSSSRNPVNSRRIPVNCSRSPLNNAAIPGVILGTTSDNNTSTPQLGSCTSANNASLTSSSSNRFDCCRANSSELGATTAIRLNEPRREAAQNEQQDGNQSERNNEHGETEGAQQIEQQQPEETKNVVKSNQVEAQIEQNRRSLEFEVVQSEKDEEQTRKFGLNTATSSKAFRSSADYYYGRSGNSSTDNLVSLLRKRGAINTPLLIPSVLPADTNLWKKSTNKA